MLDLLGIKENQLEAKMNFGLVLFGINQTGENIMVQSKTLNILFVKMEMDHLSNFKKYNLGIN